MNKQELIDILKRQLEVMPGASGGPYDGGYEYATKHHLAMIADLDEPEKPVVPQYVADWYEAIKDSFEWSLYSLCIDFHKRDLQEDLFEWFECDAANKPIETLVMMHKFGYEIEKEKLYTVEIPDPNGSGKHVLVKGPKDNVFIGHKCPNDWRKVSYYQLTKPEIKQDFEWAWQFAKEVEE